MSFASASDIELLLHGLLTHSGKLRVLDTLLRRQALLNRDNKAVSSIGCAGPVFATVLSFLDGNSQQSLFCIFNSFDEQGFEWKQQHEQR